jgi:hypothetical protein
LDHILVPTAFCGNCSVFNDQPFRISDHYPLVFYPTAHDETRHRRRSNNPPSLAGWKPLSPEDSVNYRDSVLKRVTDKDGLLSSSSINSSRLSITALQHSIIKAAESIRHTINKSRIREYYKVPDTVRKLEQQAQATVDPDARLIVRRTARVERRKWEAARDIKVAKRKPIPPLLSLYCKGRMSQDRSEWKPEIDAWICQTISDPQENYQKQSDRVKVFRDSQKVLDSQGVPPPGPIH